MADLGELDVQAQKAREKRAGGPVARPGVPPSRVGARSTAVQLAAPPEPETGAGINTTDVPHAPDGQDLQLAAVDNPLTPATISLDRTTEKLLEAVRAAGRFAQPRLDANRSATLRLAAAILAEQFTPEQIVEEMRRRAPKPSGTGRRRLS